MLRRVALSPFDLRGVWHTGSPVDMRSAPNLKKGRPWEWIRSVAFGRSACLDHQKREREQAARPEHWALWTERHILNHMFCQ